MSAYPTGPGSKHIARRLHVKATEMRTGSETASSRKPAKALERTGDRELVVQAQEFFGVPDEVWGCCLGGMIFIVYSSIINLWRCGLCYDLAF